MTVEYKSIKSKRPPLNLFEVKRVSLQGTNDDTFQKIYCARNFVIPQSGFTQKRIVETATIITGLIISNTSDSNITIKPTVAIRGLKEGDSREEFIIIKEVPIEPNDFASISLDRQVMKSSAYDIDDETTAPEDKTGEYLLINLKTGTADIHFSYIVNQREEFTEEQ